MYFKRKAYDKLLEWKKLYSEKYAVLLEGARRVGKSTIAENFAKNEYRSYILIDFSKTTSNILECFDDIGNLNIFFLRLQADPVHISQGILIEHMGGQQDFFFLAR